MIRVPSQYFDGSPAADELFAAWIDDAVDACRAVQQKFSLTPDEVAETLAQLSDAALRGIGLAPGEIGRAPPFAKD
jgi:hypothetical protein